MRKEIFIILAIVVVILLALVIYFIVSPGSETTEEVATTTEAVAGTSSTPEAGDEEGAEDTAPQESTGSTGESSASTQGARVSATTTLNLREGPGTNYPVVGSLAVNESVAVVGRNEEGTWLVVETGSGTAWLTADPGLVQTEGLAIDALPVVEAPPLPYDMSNPQVAELFNEIPLVIHNERSFTCASHAGINNLDPLAEGNVIGPHAGDFVYNGNNVLFKYSGGSLQLIRESPVAGFEDGSKTLPFGRAVQLFESGDIVWTGELGQEPGRGVTGCDPATVN